MSLLAPALPTSTDVVAGQRVEVTGLAVDRGGSRIITDVDLDVPAGTTLALLGPSGCGKTTLLRALAGLEPVRAGRIRVGDRELAGPDIEVAAERRNVGMVFQDWALFPHLTVGRNIAFGLRRRDARTEIVAQALALVDLAGMQDRSPSTLSGGQQQRVAIARALATRPDVLLLDEPFSNLDAGLREQVRGEVATLLRELGITTILVTHDQEEAFLLGDRVAVMLDGTIQQQDTPADLYQRPATSAIARFLGHANLLPATITGDVARTTLGDIPVLPSGPTVKQNAPASGNQNAPASGNQNAPASGNQNAPASGDADVLVRPEHLRLTADQTGAGLVDDVRYYGHDAVCRIVTADGLQYDVRTLSAPDVVVGDRVRVVYDGPATTAYATSRAG